MPDIKIVSIRNHETIYHSKWFVGNNYTTTNSSANTLTIALLFLKKLVIITNALHFRETISSASVLLFFGQLPTSDCSEFRHDVAASEHFE